VAKHGNRAVSSQSGSADVLRALGVNIEISPEQVAEVLEEVRITFLFAPRLHTAMKFAVPVRRDMGIRTIFNILGPLTNPAGARRQLLGVFSPSLTEVMAGVLRELGSEFALVVHGEGVFDELSTVGSSKVTELRNGQVRTYNLSAETLGFQKPSLEKLKGGDAQANAQIILDIVAGKRGAQRDIAVLNAAAALMVAGRVTDIDEGTRRANEALDSGAAERKLRQWIEATNRMK
jgi:anthranilate phosphoribosyltransferase